MNALHGGNLWAALEKSSFSRSQILDFSADLNPLGPPPGLENLLRDSWADASVYPEPAYRALRQALARLEGIDPACILPGNGAADLIHLITRWKKGRRAMVCVPTFTEYERAVLADGGEVSPWVFRAQEQFFPDPPPEPDGSDLLFLCNPNNPTGRLWPRARLLESLERWDQQGGTVVVDEAYLDFVEEDLRCSAVRWLDRFPRLIVLRSMTKLFAVPGLRLGYLAASPGWVAALGRIQPPWPVNGPAVSAGIWLSEQREYREESRRAIQPARRQLAAELAKLPGLRLFPSEANFFLCCLTSPVWTGPRLAAVLAERGILIRVCDDFTGLEPGRFFRIAVRRPEENQRLIAALREVFGHAG